MKKRKVKTKNCFLIFSKMGLFGGLFSVTSFKKQGDKQDFVSVFSFFQKLKTKNIFLSDSKRH